MNFFSEYFARISECTSKVDPVRLAQATSLILKSRDRGGKVILVGNGGSAAMASHVAVDMVKIARVRAVNFNEADLLTCLANDYGYERWVEKALEFYADPADLVILISSSGKSPNIINGARKAKEMGLPVVTLSGFQPDNPLRDAGDINFWADSREYNVVEMTHHVWLVALSDKIASDTL